MTSGATIFRSILIYGICLPVAMFLGYMLALPTDMSSLAFYSVMMGILLIPVALKWHYPLLVLFWNTTMVIPFLPGRPQAYLAVIAMSLTVSLLTRMLNKQMRFLTVTSVVLPLMFLALVMFVTARLTGGIGLRVLGGEVIGGKRYFFAFAGILGYFALTSHRIPLEKAPLYIGLFYLGAITQAVGSFIDFVPPSFYFIFSVFPVEKLPGVEFSISRPFGLAIACMAIYAFMLARYGIRGIFLSGKPWRIALFAAGISISLFGGFRSFLILALMVFAIQFYLEGLVRSRLALVLVLLGVLAAATTLPFVKQLPTSVQRTLAFLPVRVDPEVEINAQASSDWRVAMWKTALPMVPEHLLLGTGFAIDPSALEFSLDVRHRYGENYQTALLAGDFHNGPLSVILPFGIWGVFGFVWFIVAGWRALRRNYLYGDPALKTVNAYLLAAFTAQIVLFCFVFGGFYTDLMRLCGMVGMSVALNGGVSKPSPAPESATQGVKSLATIVPRVRPALGRR